MKIAQQAKADGKCVLIGLQTTGESACRGMDVESASTSFNAGAILYCALPYYAMLIYLCRPNRHYIFYDLCADMKAILLLLLILILILILEAYIYMHTICLFYILYILYILYMCS